MRPVPQQCFEMIKREEGFRAYPYLCSAAYWTRGYGEVLRAPDGRMLTSKDPAPAVAPVTKEEAAAYLHNHLIPRYMAATLRLCGADLNDNQLSALTSFTYNLGSGALRASTLRKKVLAGEHRAAAEQFGRWVIAGGKRSNGLISRRAREAALYLS